MCVAANGVRIRNRENESSKASITGLIEELLISSLSPSVMLVSSVAVSGLSLLLRALSKPISMVALTEALKWGFSLV